MKPIALAVKAVQSLPSLGWFARLAVYPCCPDPPAPAFGLVAVVELRHPGAPAGACCDLAVVASWEDEDVAWGELMRAMEYADIWRLFPQSGPMPAVRWRVGHLENGKVVPHGR